MKSSRQEKIPGIKRVLFLVEFPFSKRDFERFGIDLLIKNGFDVEVWDLTAILYPEISKSYTPPDPINWPGIKVFNDKRMVLKKLKNLPSDTFIINMIGYLPRSYRIYRAISVSRAEYAVITAWTVPYANEGRQRQGFLSDFKKLNLRIDKKTIGRAFKFIKYHIKQSFYLLPFTWIGIKPSSIILAGGEESIVVKHWPKNKQTEILWLHTLDYDLYLKERDLPVVMQSVAVFIDEYLPFHPDYFYVGVNPPSTADRYYPALNRFFSALESRLGLKVIIAADPRSHYEDHPDYFEGRRWIRGKTIQLVKESKLVLAHCTTAVNFANLFNKPVIFLTTSDQDNSFLGPQIKVMASWFGKNPVSIDTDIKIDWEQELNLSVKHYEHYRQAYIKTKNSEDLPFWQIVANRLKRM